MEFKTDIDLKSLEKELQEAIKGEVRFDDGSRGLYSTDASNYRQIPYGVVIPKNMDEVPTIIEICHKHKAPILGRGGGTSLAGQSCNEAVIIDYSKYCNNILEINKEEKYAVVEPGVVLDDLRRETEKYDLSYGPDPATHNRCTFGGMIGNNSCGIHSVLAGRTVDNMIEMEILTYDGLRMTVGPTSEERYNEILDEGGRKADIYKGLKEIAGKNAELVRKRYPDIPRRVSGYNLDFLLPENEFNLAKALVGTESTCVVILKMKVRLVEWPKKRSLLVLGYPDVFQAGDHVSEIMKHNPIGLEGIDHALVDFMERKGLNVHDINLLPDGKGWLLVEFGGNTKEDADNLAKETMKELKKDKTPPTMKLYDDLDEEEKVWEIRESGLGATAHIPNIPEQWPGWEDSAVPPKHVGNYLRDLKALFSKYNYSTSVYGHFGQGCIHCRIPFDLKTAKGIDDYKKFIDEASDLVLKYNGSFSGEHGDGQSRGPLLDKMYGKELTEAFREFKRLWDPDWKMNPGKVVDAYPIDSNLRLGTDYNPKQYKTQFKFPADGGDFSKTMLRCVGVGKCRKKESGIMCPSYMVTHEEKHSTRGRARLLFEMMRGDVVNGWNDKYVKESLDLCLACKGCKSECPVDVDMATYKAEYLYHYYKRHPRPRQAYSFGLIYWVSKLAMTMPEVVNFFTQNRPFAAIIKKLGGIAQKREVPRYAPETFRKWYEKNHRPINYPDVILWVDTFNNNFHPETLIAAYEVLRDAGYNVKIPQKQLCCGRPLYDYGMLTLAKYLLRQIIQTMREDIHKGTPVIGLEPSCVAVFRDELGMLYPHDEDAKRLNKQVFTLAEFVDGHKENFRLPEIKQKAVVHGHCHQESVLGFEKDINLLQSLGLDLDVLDSGCCGMAGSFGFENEKYDVSVKVGQRVLIPSVNEASENTIILADGFSCKTQIEDLSSRKSLHLAELLHGLKFDKASLSVPDNYPKKIFETKMNRKKK